MRAAPPLEFRVARFGVWRSATLALTATACAALAIWWAAHPVPVPVWVSVVAALGILGATASALPLLRGQPFVLCLNAGQWQFRLAAEPREQSMTGELDIALDFGAWLLLRFIPDSAGSRARWLAVQRRGLERQWHALRCAIHAPRRKPPAAGAMADG